MQVIDADACHNKMTVFIAGCWRISIFRNMERDNDNRYYWLNPDLMMAFFLLGFSDT